MQPNDDHGLAWQGRVSPALFLYPVAHLGVEVYNTVLSIMWPLLATRFDLSFGVIGLLTMIFRGSMTLPQLPFATICDRWGSRLFGIWGLVWMAVGMSLVGRAPSVAVLAILLAVAPLGSAAFHPAGTSFMSRAMPRRRGQAVALFMIGGTLGSSLGPLVGAWLFGRRGLEASPWLMPFGLMVALVMALLIPSDAPVGSRQTQNSRPKAPIPPAVFLIMGATICVAWIENGLMLYLPLLMTDRGLSLEAASRALFVYSASMSVGVLVGGTLSDHVPRWCVIALALALSGPLYAATVLLGGQGTLLVPALLGFVSALSHPTAVALAQELMPDRASLAAALTMGISWVLGSLGVTLTGALADSLGVQTALLLNTVWAVVGVASIVAYRLTTGRATAAAG